MSITLTASKSAVPIAKDKKANKIIYFEDISNGLPILPSKNVKQFKYICPSCKKDLKRKTTFIEHVLHTCKNKEDIDRKKVKYETLNELMVIPRPQEQHQIIFVSGPPGSGKSHYTNDFSKAFKKLYGARIILFTRNTEDETLDEELYEKVLIDDIDINKKFDPEEFRDCLVIFDDIESSTKPKVTKYMYQLLSDLAKNGRHVNCTVIYTNQEAMLGIRTKTILRICSDFVIFPKFASKHEVPQVLRKYFGMNQNQIDYVLNVNSRWACIRKIAPQYVIHQHGIYIIGCEIY